jgi:hypothetical protein
MESTWYRAEATLGKVAEPTHWAMFLKYDLRVWLFGLRIDPDPSWFSFSLGCGPLEFEFYYWRQPVQILQ